MSRPGWSSLQFSPTLAASYLAWGASLAAAPMLLLFKMPHVAQPVLSPGLEHASVVLATLAVAGTLLLGGVLGWRRLWWHLPVAAAAGTAVLASFYVAAIFAFPPDSGGTDNEAGAGLVVLALPTLLLLEVLLGAGSGIGWASSMMRRLQARERGWRRGGAPPPYSAEREH